MRVLLVTKTRTGGGTETHVTDVVDGLKQRGWDVQAAYTEDGFGRLYGAIAGCDLVHFYLPRPYLLGSLACWLARSKAVRIMSRRSLTDSYQTPLIRFIEKLLHRRTNILVGNSPAVVDQLRQEAPHADIRLIRNGV